MKPEEFERVLKLPFHEAAQFFRDKLTMESSAWDELNGAAHAKAFTSAGAYHADLLAELRAMTDKAIAGGMDIREFRKQFRPLVARYGWQLKGGGAAWRSDLIWRTNIATAYQAGRWQQFRDGGIAYLKYVHSDGVRHPRPNHLAMDGRILPMDDPFWSVNYPPNGWGCKCRAVAVQDREVGKATAESRTRPEGWEKLADEGWRYNVGQAGEEQGYKALTEKFESLPNDIARAWMDRWIKEPAFARFIEGRIEGEFPVAVLREETMALFGSEHQAVWLTADAIAEAAGELSIDDYRLLPEIIAKGETSRQDKGLLISMQVGNVGYRVALQTGERNSLRSFIKIRNGGMAEEQ